MRLFATLLAAGMSCLILAPDVQASNITYLSADVYARANEVSYEDFAPESASLTATSGSASSIAGLTVDDSSISETLSQSFVSQSITAGKLEIRFSVATNSTFTVGGSWDIVDPFNNDLVSCLLLQGNVFLYDPVADGTSTGTFPSGSGTLQPGFIYDFVLEGNVSAIPDPSLTSSILLQVTAGSPAPIPEPSTTALSAVALLTIAGFATFAKRFFYRISFWI